MSQLHPTTGDTYTPRIMALAALGSGASAVPFGARTVALKGTRGASMTATAATSGTLVRWSWRPDSATGPTGARPSEKASVTKSAPKPSYDRRIDRLTRKRTTARSPAPDDDDDDDDDDDEDDDEDDEGDDTTAALATVAT